MKRKIFKPIQIVVLLIATLFTTNSCSDVMNNPLKDKETGEDLTLLLLDLNFFDTKLILRFEDFDTGDLLVGQAITTSIVGLEADRFVTVFGEKKDEHTTSSGILELYLDPAYKFTETPIELEVLSFSNPLWLSQPTSIEISEAGEVTVIVKMIDWSKSAPVLKSAMAGVTISVNQQGGTVKEKNLNDAAGGNGYINLIEYFNVALGDPNAAMRSQYKYMYDLYLDLYNQYGNQSLLIMANIWLNKLNALPAPPTTPDVKLTATGISLDENTVEYWGFANNKGKEVTLKVGEKIHTTYKRNNLSKCPSGLTIKVNAPELTAGDLTSSSSFNYTITFSDGNTKSGAVSGSFKNLSENGSKIEPLYYPTGSRVTVTLTGNSQYEFETPIQSNLDPCGVVTFVAKKKINLVQYNFSVTYSCAVAGLTYTGSGLFKNISKGTQPELFSLSTGGFSLRMVKGDTYELTVLIDNEPYSMNVETNNIKGSLEGKSFDGNTIKSVIVTGNDADGYIVTIDVGLTDEICGKITG